jgi:hypothetical protein
VTNGRSQSDRVRESQALSVAETQSPGARKPNPAKWNGTRKARAEAEKAASKWEDELRDGRYQPPSRISWEEFRERYESEVLPSHTPTRIAELTQWTKASFWKLKPQR